MMTGCSVVAAVDEGAFAGLRPRRGGANRRMWRLGLGAVLPQRVAAVLELIEGVGTMRDVRSTEELGEEDMWLRKRPPEPVSRTATMRAVKASRCAVRLPAWLTSACQ